VNEHTLDDAVENANVERKVGNGGGMADGIGHAAMVDPSVEVIHV